MHRDIDITELRSEVSNIYWQLKQNKARYETTFNRSFPKSWKRRHYKISKYNVRSLLNFRKQMMADFAIFRVLED